nr:group II intron reverse transcriptase/maturase [Streptococcus equi]
MKNGKAIHRNNLLHDDDFSIVQTYQQEYRGLVQYYILAQNLSWFSKVYWYMETSLLKTLAFKHKSSINKMLAKYKLLQLARMAERCRVTGSCASRG